MWDFLRTVFGEVTVDELVIVGIIFFSVLAFGWAPKAGELVGGVFEQDEE